MGVPETLSGIAAVGDQKARAEQYRAVLGEVIATGNAEPCKQFIDHSACFPRGPGSHTGGPIAHVAAIWPFGPCSKHQTLVRCA